MRQQISKSKFKLMVWGIIIGGLLMNAITGHLFITSGVSESQMRLGFWMAISLLITGFGVGTAYARCWKINGVDN